MANLILHIGGYKTGSTYLQSLFSINRAFLRSLDITYPHFFGCNAHHGLAAKWIDAPDARDCVAQMGGTMAPWQRLISDDHNSSTTVLVSTELLSNDTIDLHEVAQLARSFDRVRVVYFARTQAELAQSIWQQLARSGKRRAIHAFMKSAIETQKIGGVLLNHNAVYSRLIDAFGADNVRVISFDSARQDTGGLETAFFRCLDARINSARLNRPERASRNASFDPLCYYFASAISTPPSSDLLRVIEAAVGNIYGQRETTSLLARHEYRKMTTAFRRSNAKLTERVRQFQPDFAFQIPDPPENTLFRPEKDTELWVAVAQALHATCEKTNRDPKRFWSFIKTPR